MLPVFVFLFYVFVVACFVLFCFVCLLFFFVFLFCFCFADVVFGCFLFSFFSLHFIWLNFKSLQIRRREDSYFPFQIYIWKTLQIIWSSQRFFIRFKDVCVNKEHRVLLSYGPITAIPALKVGHTCTAGTVTTDCGVATTTHLECSATAPTVCVCSTGYSGPTGGDCGGWHIPIVYCGRKNNN